MEALAEARAESGVEDGKHPFDKLDEANIYEIGVPRDVIPKAIRDRHFKVRKDQKNAHGNDHPTVKPKGVFQRLLADVPLDATVLDPFSGSGSLALACLETGHDCVCIEKEAEYVQIADARVRYWDSAKTGWVRAEIESEAEPVEKPEDNTLSDKFGF
jgi:DNA modification methylase